MLKKILFAFFEISLIYSCVSNSSDKNQELYDLDSGIKSRSISFENPTGEPGKGGMAANKELGVGRKGAASKTIKPGETIVLCDIKNSGTIRHIWMTGTFNKHFH